MNRAPEAGRAGPGFEQEERIIMEEVRLKVPDMSCGHCIGAIQRAMEMLDGVSSVEASLETKIVTIQADRVLNKEEVLAAVTGVGYSPEWMR